MRRAVGRRDGRAVVGAVAALAAAIVGMDGRTVRMYDICELGCIGRAVTPLVFSGLLSEGAGVMRPERCGAGVSRGGVRCRHNVKLNER